jgi:hypothetical protein
MRRGLNILKLASEVSIHSKSKGIDPWMTRFNMIQTHNNTNNNNNNNNNFPYCDVLICARGTFSGFL